MRTEQTTPLQIALGEKLRELRHARQLTLEQVADKLRKGKTDVSYIERGKRNITLKNMAAFAKLYKIKLAEMFEGM